MTGAEDVIQGMRRFLCSDFSAEPRGLNAFLIHTGFVFPDGDELHIVMRLEGDGWVLTDDGHTMMWLSYEDLNITPSREALLRRTLESNFIHLDGGRLWVGIDGGNAADALRSMVQAALQIADLLFLSRQTVRSTFSEDVRSFFAETFKNRCEFDRRIRVDGETYTADVSVPGDEPLLVFSISSQERCMDATCAIMALTGKMEFTSLVIIDDCVSITKEVLKRITNRSDKLYYGVPEAGGDLSRFLQKRGTLARMLAIL